MIAIIFNVMSIHWCFLFVCIGIYVLMLQDIFHSFLKMTALSFVLVITFALTFYMAFFEPGIEFSRSPFATPGRAIIKTITMTTGEFEYDGIFRQTPGGLSPGTTDIPPELPFLPISFLLWIIFIIVMPILLTNLLVYKYTCIFSYKFDCLKSPHS